MVNAVIRIEILLKQIDGSVIGNVYVDSNEENFRLNH